ncbi:hypothetical protein BDR03DRAFT_940838 [Suillus americanus]|nr:hypothetical protein BDR03DRAFT_940838 [Suillus americanus]
MFGMLGATGRIVIDLMVMDYFTGFLQTLQFVPKCAHPLHLMTFHLLWCAIVASPRFTDTSLLFTCRVDYLPHNRMVAFKILLYIDKVCISL